MGATNLDYRSCIHANDANLVIWSKAFAARMERQFLDDQEKNHEITLSQWRDRNDTGIWWKYLPHFSTTGCSEVPGEIHSFWVFSLSPSSIYLEKHRHLKC